MATLSAVTLLERCWLSYLSWPGADRPVYRAVFRQAVRSVLEIGVGQGRRTQRLLGLLLRQTPQDAISYVGIDLFEDRPATCKGRSLKEFYRELAALRPRVKFRLLPGGPGEALQTHVHFVGSSDLVIISGDQEEGSVARAWQYLPRVLKPNSQVLLQTGGVRGGFRRLSAAEIHKRVEQAAPRARRAA